MNCGDQKRNGREYSALDELEAALRSDSDDRIDSGTVRSAAAAAAADQWTNDSHQSTSNRSSTGRLYDSYLLDQDERSEIDVMDLYGDSLGIRMQPSPPPQRRQRQSSLYSNNYQPFINRRSGDVYRRDFLAHGSMTDLDSSSSTADIPFPFGTRDYFGAMQPPPPPPLPPPPPPPHYHSLSNLYQQSDISMQPPPRRNIPSIEGSFDFEAMNEVIQSLANNLAWSAPDHPTIPHVNRRRIYQPSTRQPLRCASTDAPSVFLPPRRPPGGVQRLPKTFIRKQSENERYSRKVFLGGLPTDITESEIVSQFVRFGPLTVDWPQRQSVGGNIPPKGYAFVIFCNESSVQALLDSSIHKNDSFYTAVSSSHVQSKLVQVKPWILADSDHVKTIEDGDQPIDPRKTIFVGGVPRPMRASELATIMNEMFGGVCYAGIDTDPDLKYPKGAARVAFSDQKSYLMAIRNQYVRITGSNIDKQVEIKPYLLDDQMCDQCGGEMCDHKPAPYFCPDESCLQYYCNECWDFIHRNSVRRNHRPMVKESGGVGSNLPSIQRRI
ncbi:hypothetical protein ACOME3_005985 [Neoechinorhynchus agilis]